MTSHYWAGDHNGRCLYCKGPDGECPESPAVIRQQKKDKALEEFSRLCSGWMDVDQGGVWDQRPLPVYRRLREALRALRSHRRLNNQQEREEDEVSLGVRIVADAMAGEISAAAGEGQDPNTIAWVVAGLRCPRRPFCLGCDACFTVDSPHRSDVQFMVTCPPSGEQS
jgi:hypothetical protein